MANNQFEPSPLKHALGAPSPITNIITQWNPYAPNQRAFDDPASLFPPKFINPNDLHKNAQESHRISSPTRFREDPFCSISLTAYTQFTTPFQIICAHCTLRIERGTEMQMKMEQPGETCYSIPVYHIWLDCLRCKREMMVEMHAMRGFVCKIGVIRAGSALIGEIAGWQRKFFDERGEKWLRYKAKRIRRKLLLEKMRNLEVKAVVENDDVEGDVK